MLSYIISVKDFFNGDPKGFSQNPQKLVSEAARFNKETGSSTLVVATIDSSTNKVKTALVGDSGYMILKPKDGAAKLYEIDFKSKEQQHSFNFPFQLGTHGDSPESAHVVEHDVYPNYLIVMGTDGLFDNLYGESILKEVNAFLSSNSYNGPALAKRISDTAFGVSLDPVANTPFAEGAKKARMYFKGGKSDDITVVIGRVCE